MAINKNTNSDYVISTPRNSGSNITLNTDTVYIPGNLTVLGATTSITTENTAIKDNNIVLNDGETGNGVVTLGTTSGIIVARGIAAGGNVQLRWNETTKTWQVSGVKSGSPGDGSEYLNLTTSVGTSALTAVIDGTAPQLGGNLLTNSYGLGSSDSTNTYFAGNLQILYTGSAPTTQGNSTVVYGATPGAGTSGVYVVNGSAANEELITKRRAFGFSLLL